MRHGMTQLEEANYHLMRGQEHGASMTEAQQIDLDGQPNTIPPDPPAPTEPGPPPVQLGLDVDVPVAIRKRRRGPVVAWQDPL